MHTSSATTSFCMNKLLIAREFSFNFSVNLCDETFFSRENSAFLTHILSLSRNIVINRRCYNPTGMQVLGLSSLENKSYLIFPSFCTKTGRFFLGRHIFLHPSERETICAGISKTITDTSAILPQCIRKIWHFTHIRLIQLRIHRPFLPDVSVIYYFRA